MSAFAFAKFLERFPEFIAFKEANADADSEREAITPDALRYHPAHLLRSSNTPASTRQKASSSRLRLSLRKQLASALAIKVVLLDGLKLANLMIGHGIGVTTESVYEIKRIDSDYFDLA